ncbi:MAG: hypothetical protein ACREJB_15015 [Planctomycetaceae bacterium]
MFLAYFVIDRDQQLRRAAPEMIEALWHGQVTTEELRIEVGEELRLISVLCLEDLTPAVCFFARLELEDGLISREAKINLFEAMAQRRVRRFDHPLAREQFHGWPSDWQRQLAVALDVPALDLKKISLGGPLVMSELWGVPLEKVLAYFEEAAGEGADG